MSRQSQRKRVLSTFLFACCPKSINVLSRRFIARRRRGTCACRSAAVCSYSTLGLCSCATPAPVFVAGLVSVRCRRTRRLSVAALVLAYFAQRAIRSRSCRVRAFQTDRLSCGSEVVTVLSCRSIARRRRGTCACRSATVFSYTTLGLCSCATSAPVFVAGLVSVRCRRTR